MLVAFSFSSITCFRMVRDDLMASFNVIDCFEKLRNGKKRLQTAIYYDCLIRIKRYLGKTTKYLNIINKINITAGQ